MQGYSSKRIIGVMVSWLAILGGLLAWLLRDMAQDEDRLALTTANAFYQQIVVSRQWNASHGGVYVPITEETPPNEYLPLQGRDLVADNGMRLTKVNPSYMTRQMAEIARQRQDGIQFHVTSLKPVRPENAPTDWEREWLQSFEKGAKEQGAFFDDGTRTWFRYMAPLFVNPHCLTCHAEQGYKEGDLRGGISISLPYYTPEHVSLFIGYGAVALVGLIFIFGIGTLYERKRLLFDATFNSTVPTCVTDKAYNILIANESYWREFGALPPGRTSMKCYDHRPGKACHTEKCPLSRIMSGVTEYVCEPSKEKDGRTQSFIVTARPLLDVNGKVLGTVESFQDITDRKRLETEKEELIEELTASLENVKLLSGLIPICASCKKVRDDKGYWSQVETYISHHSEAKFSHGICPECVKKLYPDYCEEILRDAARPRALAATAAADEDEDEDAPAETR